MNLLIRLTQSYHHRLIAIHRRVGPLIKYILASVSAIFFFTACGIENYLYIYPVRSVYTSQDGLIRFVLPEDQEDIGSYFRGYRIYYKIYKSPILTEHNSNTFSQINVDLQSHYSVFSPYLSGTDNAPIGIINTFESEPRAYHILEYAGSANPLTGSTIHGSTVEIDFNELQDEPVMMISGNAYYLRRSSSVVQLLPTNDRSFIYDKDNFSGTDVNENENGSEFAYIALYILGIGVDDNMSNAYSSPTYLGLLRLPDKNL